MPRWIKQCECNNNNNTKHILDLKSIFIFAEHIHTNQCGYVCLNINIIIIDDSLFGNGIKLF